MYNQATARARRGLLAKRGCLFIAVTASLALAGCNSGADNSLGRSPASDSNDVVTLTTGGGPDVTLPKEGLHIGLFMAAKTNAYQAQMIKGAEAAAEKFDAKLTVFDANYDPKTQMDQIQNALQQGEINAIIMQPTSGDLLCDMASKTLPNQGYAVIAAGTTLCGYDIGDGDELAAPGTVAFSGANAAKSYITGYLDQVAQFNPGKHTVALVSGPETLAYTQAFDTIAKEWQTSHPDIDIKYTAYTNYTTPDALAKTQALLKAHSDIDLIVEVYSPDIARGVIGALEAQGLAGKIPVTDLGGSEYAYQQMKAGNIQFTIPLNPYNIGYRPVESLVQAQSGKPIPRFIDDSVLGTAVDPVAITVDTLDTFDPQY